MPVLANTSASTGPTPRPQAPNGARPRPMSMPLGPQSYSPATPADSVVNTGSNAQNSAAPASAATNGAGSSSSRNQKTRSSNRVLGDYIIGKTLGQGSMGKVKLAYHNITGEKVRRVAFLVLWHLILRAFFLPISNGIACHQDSSSCWRLCCTA